MPDAFALTPHTADLLRHLLNSAGGKPQEEPSHRLDARIVRCLPAASGSGSGGAARRWPGVIVWHAAAAWTDVSAPVWLRELNGGALKPGLRYLAIAGGAEADGVPTFYTHANLAVPASGSGSGGDVEPEVLIGWVVDDVRCVDGRQYVDRKPHYASASGERYGPITTHAAGCCECGPYVSGSGSGSGGGGTGPGSPCCGGTTPTTLYAAFGGTTLTLTYDGSHYWTGAGTVGGVAVTLKFYCYADPSWALEVTGSSEGTRTDLPVGCVPFLWSSSSGFTIGTFSGSATVSETAL